jgi:pre-mRNA-splicing factor SYF1
MLHSTDVNFIASQAIARSAQTAESADGTALDDKIDAMAALERQARAPAGFVPASSGPVGAKASEEKVVTSNPDAIDVDLDDL